MSVAWTEAARAAVFPHRRAPGGIAWPDPARAERLRARVRELEAPRVRGWAKRTRGEPELRDRTRAVVAAGGVRLPPPDEAVRALLLGAAEWKPGDEAASVLVGWWAAAGGPGHAVASAAHTLGWEDDRGRLARRAGWGFDPDELGLWHALRRLGVTLDDAQAADAVAGATRARDELAALGPGRLVLDAALAFALPWAPEIARPAGRALLAALASWTAQPLLHGARVHGWCVLASVDEPELALQVATHVGAFADAQVETFAATLLDRLGDDALAVLARLFEGAGRAAARRQLAETIALVEDEAAASWLARHLGHPQAAATAAGWLRAHPALAIPALAAAAGGRRADAGAGALLAQLVGQHGLPAGVRLSPKTRALLARSAPTPPPSAPQADDAALPAVFARLGRVPRKLPAFLTADVLPAVRLSTGERVSPAAITGLLRGLAAAAPDIPADDAEAVRSALDPGDALALGRAVLDVWLGAGAPPREGWVVLAFGVLAPVSGAMVLARLVDGWAREARVRRAVLGLDGLAAMGTDEAVFALQRLAVKATAPSVAERAGELLEEIAAARGLDPALLEDVVLPDLGLDAAGRIRLDYGSRVFHAGFDERGKAVVTDAEGRLLARLPPAGRADDARAAEEAQERWKDVRAAGEFVLARHSARLEAAMCTRRALLPEAFWRLVRHPLVAQLAKRVVWRAGAATFRVAEDWTLADADDREVTLPAVPVDVPHPLEVPDDLRARWSALLADYELVPPFPQMQRPVYRPTEKEKGASEILRVDGRPTSRAKLYGLRHRGWEGMADETGTVLARPLDGDTTAFLDVADGRLGPVRLRGGGRVRLGALDPIVFSELVRELEWAALGNSADDVDGR